MRYLPESQTHAFDIDQISNDRCLWFNEMVENSFGNAPIRVLDIGGGSGIFADKIIKSFPNSELVLLDYSKNLLQKNIEHPRKRLVLGSVENLLEIFPDEKFDLVTINLVLHHLVGSNYRESKENAANTLNMIQKILSDRGRVFVCENIYNGLVIDSLASRCIYTLTSIRNPFITKLFRKWGANTAGTGVCFQSSKMWHQVMRQVGFRIDKYEQDPFRRVKKSRAIALHIGAYFFGYFWLAKQIDNGMLGNAKKPKEVA